MAKVIHRGNTVTLSFTFKDATGATATVVSAECELVYPGRDEYQKETLTLTESSGAWSATWVSSNTRGGWVEFHAEGTAAGDVIYTEDGRFKVKSNEANLQHTELPEGSNSLKDYQG